MLINCNINIKPTYNLCVITRNCTPCLRTETPCSAVLPGWEHAGCCWFWNPHVPSPPHVMVVEPERMYPGVHCTSRVFPGVEGKGGVGTIAFG